MPGNQRPTSVPYHISKFSGGQSDYEDRGIAGSYKSSYNLDPRKQKDTLSCNQVLKDDLAAGTMTAPAYFMVPCSDGNTYILTYDGKIYRRNSAGSYLLVYTDTHEAGNINGACEWFSSAGWTYLIWATPSRLNIKKLAGPSYTQTEPWNDVNVADTGTWPKTNLTAATPWHTMAVANGALQICNGNVMALVGYDLSYTNQSLRLIPGNAARCVLERSKYGIIGCTKTDNKDESSFFSWDGIGLSWNDKQIIKFSTLQSMVDTEIALSHIGNGQLYISDFVTPIPFRVIRGGGQSNPDGVTAYHGMALIGIYNNTNLINGVYANGIYSIGRVNKNASIILNLEYQLTCDEIYSVKTVGTDILVSYKLNGSYGIKIVDTANKAIAVYQSLDLVAPIKRGIPIGRLLNWERIDLECQPLPAGCMIECWGKYEKGDDWVQLNTDPGNTGGGTQFQGTGNRNAVFYSNQRARVFEVQLILIPSGNTTPEVNEINVYVNSGG